MHADARSLPRLGLVLALVIAAVLAMKANPALAAQPVVNSLSPTTGTTAGGTTVVITGTGFTGVTGAGGVTFGGTNAASYTVNNDSQITAVSPAHAAGTVDVVVTHPTDGNSGATGTANDFTYVAPPAPTVTAVSPNTCTTAGGTTITISGTNLTGATAVNFGAATATPTNVTATSLQAVCPAVATAGTVSVRVTTPGGTSADTAQDDFTYTVGVPTVTDLDPAGGPVSGGTTVTVTGTGFVNVTAVTFGGVPGTAINVTNSTTLTVVSPGHAAGTVDVLVVTAQGTSANTTADNFTYGTIPVITSVAPNTGPIAGGTSVVITGSGFTGATDVTFGGTDATSFTVDSATQITAVAPAHAAGTVDIVVTTPLGINTNTPADNFTYSAAPFITSISPTGGPTAGGTSVVITGTGFTGVTAVTFGGTAATSFTVNSNTQITAVAPARTAGTVDIVVTSPQGSSANTTADNYTYGSAPVITSISPSSGPTAGGTLITITGSGFTGATAVQFDGTNVTPTVVSDTQITVTSPPHANGVVSLRVVTPLGTSADTAADNFTYGTGTTTSFTLYFRWTLIVWSGKDGADVNAALKGQETPDNPATNDISGVVTAIFHYNNPQQKFEGYFPGSAGIPGANDFTTFQKGQPYWIAISQTGSLTWTVLAD